MLDIFLQATIERLHSNNILSLLVIQKTFFKLKEVKTIYSLFLTRTRKKGGG